MTAAQILGLDQRHAHCASKSCAKARSGDPAADDQDLDRHSSPKKIAAIVHGYGLESRAV
jgi:hypothetical protein